MKTKIRIDKKTRLRLYLELSKYSLDLSKLIFGGIILSGVMGLSISKDSLILFGIIAVFLTAILGFGLFVMGNKK